MYVAHAFSYVMRFLWICESSSVQGNDQHASSNKIVVVFKFSKWQIKMTKKR